MTSDAPTGLPAAVPAVAPPPEPTPLPPWFKRGVVYVGFVVLAFLVGAWMFTGLRSFWPVLLFAFFIGLALTPLVNGLVARGWRRGTATGVLLAAFLVGALLFFAVFGQLLFGQLAQLITAVPGYIEAIIDFVNERYGTEFSASTLLNQFGISSSDLAGAAGQIGAGAIAVIVGAATGVFNLFMMLFFAFYFAAQGPNLRRTVASWLQPSRQRTFQHVWDISVDMAGGYVISRGILAFISATAHSVFFLAIGLPYWLPLGLWVGLVSQFVPTIGTYLAGALPIIIALVSGEPGLAIAVLAFVLVYQQVENLFLTPRITQSTLEVNAAIAFGSVIVGGILFGPTGALLSIPVVATILAVLQVYGKRYELVPELAAEHEADRRREASRGR
jgi:predicted PurR-regulated permease PerM